MITIKYLDRLTFQPTENGSIITIEDIDVNNNTETYTVTGIDINFNGSISVTGDIHLTLNGKTDKYFKSSFKLVAINEEFDSFVTSFGHQANAIYPFIVNAIITKYELT